MAGVGLHAQDHRPARSRGRLQPGGHLAGLPGGDAGIVDAGGEQHGRIAHAVAHMAERIHLAQAPEAFRIGDRAELGHVRRSGLHELEAQRVGVADPDDGDAQQVGPLGEEAADHDAAGRGAFHRQLRRLRPALANEILGAVDAVAPGVGLGQLLAARVPGVAQLAAAAHVGHGVDAAEVEPRQNPRRKGRIEVELVGAIGGQVGGRAAVAGRRLGVDDRERHERPIANLHHHLAALVGADVDVRLGRDVSQRDRPVRRAAAEHRRLHPAFQQEPAAVGQGVGVEARDRAGVGEPHHGPACGRTGGTPRCRSVRSGATAWPP